MVRIIPAVLLLALIPFKQVLIIFFPLLMILIGRVRQREVITLFLIFAYTLLSLFLSRDMLLLNQIVSLFLLFPVIFFLVFRVSFFERVESKGVGWGLRVFCYILLLNGSVGAVQYLMNPGDDAAIGFYGRSGLEIHGLAILYVLASIYFYANSTIKYHKTKSALALFFMLTCFYGAGVMAVFLAVSLCVILGSKNKIRAVSFLLIAVASFVSLGFIVSPKTMVYNYNNIILFFNSITDIISGNSFNSFGISRKLVAWLNYFVAIKDSPHSIVFGFGGGTFNSRAAFFLNGDYSSISFIPKSISQWHEVYIMPLWSNYILSQQYQDGTMNQPFSSVLAVLSEYGIAGLTFVFLAFKRLRSYLISQARLRQGWAIKVLLLDFMFFYIAALCLTDNILEYVEIVLPFFILLFSLPIIGAVKKKKIGGMVK